jgi:hypothetical protein
LYSRRLVLENGCEEPALDRLFRRVFSEEREEELDEFQVPLMTSPAKGKTNDYFGKRSVF